MCNRVAYRRKPIFQNGRRGGWEDAMHVAKHRALKQP